MGQRTCGSQQRVGQLMFDTLMSDYNRYWVHYGYDQSHPLVKAYHIAIKQGAWAVTDYRFRRWMLTTPRWFQLVMWLPKTFWQLFIATLTGIEIETSAVIGKGLFVPHFTGIFVNADCVIGENCTILQGVTLGIGGDSDGRSPQVGNNVYIGAGAKVIGGIKVGDNASIGGNSLVVSSVPENFVAFGVPARAMPKVIPSVPKTEEVTS